MKFLDKKDLSLVGFVNRTSGFKGEVSCRVEAASINRLLKQKFFFILFEGLPVPFMVEKSEEKNDTLIVKFEDINSEQDAKKLVQKDLYAIKGRNGKRKEAMSWKDLKGYLAVDNSYGTISIIDDVTEYPMQMIARCLVNGKEVLFPLNEDVIEEIDDDARTITLNLPDGLLDVYLKSP
jgi:16S rRNA processing protein RimM